MPSLDPIVALCKRRGFVYQASEIYGGLNGFWDYGPLGVELKNNLRDAWWRDMTRCPPLGPDGRPVEIVGLDSAIIQNPRVWEASGHVAGFNDPMVDCRETKARYRADHLGVYLPPAEDPQGRYQGLIFAFEREGEKTAHKQIRKFTGQNPETYTLGTLKDLPLEAYARVVAPGASAPGTLTEPRQFNLMFKTYVGASATEANQAYLRPETAQGIFTNFKNVVDTMRVKVPFGIAQVGKAFRNEVTPRNFIFRSREFEQMELEFFCHPDESEKWYAFWVETRLNWWRSLGISSDNLIKREHAADELAHYSRACADVEYRYPFTDPEYGELEGVAHRGAFDLGQHMKKEHSGVNLEYVDPVSNQRYVPHVIEPSSGLTRGVLVLLCEAYREEWVGKAEGSTSILPAEPGKMPPEGYEARTVMRFHPRLAPIKVAVFPLLRNKPELVEKAQGVFASLRRRFSAFYDETGAIGRRYRRMDEAGTPYCVTVDFDSLQDNTVTLRDRDTMAQTRVSIAELEALLRERTE
jgi:glycyl-tRNA synthetase